jgi:hypothetical protein
VKFTSPFAAFQAFVRDPELQYFSDGRSRTIRPELVANFAEDATDETYQGQEGEPNYVAMRGGGFFDSEVAKTRHGWTDEEHDAVVQYLLDLVPSGDVKVHEPAKAVPPWPTYDEMHPEHIAERAMEMGLVNQSLLYEQRTLNRDEITGPLTEYAQQHAGEEELTAA